MKKGFRITLLIVISFLSFANVSAIHEIYTCADSDSLTVSEEELVAGFETEMEVESWMLEPFQLKTAVYVDQIADIEPEIRLEAWMIEPFVSPAGSYAYEDNTGGKDLIFPDAPCCFCVMNDR